ncbi:MAG TPA: 3'-5' exonuclease [bacterium]|nr:3'-5' exonuclease [bacterium]HOL47952.1 3'-5' exonuclease [bacterium]HPQ19301.1 3'-5' exonuclease [bacterium]
MKRKIEISQFTKNILAQLLKTDNEKEIYHFYMPDFDTFLNPFVINNISKALSLIKSFMYDKSAEIVIHYNNELSSIFSAYLISKFFKWQKKEIIFNDISVSLRNRLNIIVGSFSISDKKNQIIKITDYDKINEEEKNELIIFNNFTEEKYKSKYSLSLEVLTFKLIQSLFLSEEELFNKTFVAYDLETTGTSMLDEIIEIGAVKYRNGVKVDKFQTLVNPQRFIPQHIVNLTNITNEMVKNAPVIKDVIKDFANFLSDADFIVVHNGGLDISFISKAYKKYLNKTFNMKSYDTRMIAQSIRPMSGLSLGAISEDMGIELIDAHRAAADAEATGDSFIKLILLKQIGLKIFTNNYLSVIIPSMLITPKKIIGENRLYFISAINNLKKCKVYLIKSLLKKIDNFNRFEILKIFYKLQNALRKFQKETIFSFIEKYLEFTNIKLDEEKDYLFNTDKFFKIELTDLKYNSLLELEYLIPLTKENYIPVFFVENITIEKIKKNKRNEIIGTVRQNNIKKKFILKDENDTNKNNLFFIILIEKFLFIFKKIKLKEI